MRGRWGRAGSTIFGVRGGRAASGADRWRGRVIHRAFPRKRRGQCGWGTRRSAGETGGRRGSGAEGGAGCGRGQGKRRGRATGQRGSAQSVSRGKLFAETVHFAGRLHGDSITQFWTEDPLFARNPHFVGRGVSGQTTRLMLARFRTDVIEPKPALVHIMGAGPHRVCRLLGRAGDRKRRLPSRLVRRWSAPQRPWLPVDAAARRPITPIIRVD